ncbi:hypothetical protein EVAR_2868_1 [Eumeta japonica]|uniref:Uncharacterized protein n=1 Tax=Eumeta variegata TaxID=151549 RepID=A0A4C1T1K5_EUMVA|nr:hypothetical protein EVAR_2868_1 [Eumeta japonica]
MATAIILHENKTTDEALDAHHKAISDRQDIWYSSSSEMSSRKYAESYVPGTGGESVRKKSSDIKVRGRRRK